MGDGCCVAGMGLDDWAGMDYRYNFGAYRRGMDFSEAAKPNITHKTI